jgi:hypothetical protein
MEHKKQSKSEKQYLRGVIHNLSLQRWTDQEITDYLREKGTNIARTTVNSIKNQIEKQAENWYIELRQSRYKFVATYKERLDSLLLYQKKLNDILDSSKKEETKIKAITALQSIELDIFNIFKQLPDLRIEDVKENNELPDPGLGAQAWGSTSIDKPRALDEESYTDEENREYFEQKMKKYEERISNAWDIPIPVAIQRQRDTSAQEIKKDRVITPASTDTEQDKDEEDDYVWKLE